jgi:hypothetical protein
MSPIFIWKGEAMETTRREFLVTAAAAGSAIAAGGSPPPGAAEAGPGPAGDKGYRFRIAFGCWINDMRNGVLPLQNWPAPQLDDETMASAIAALDVQARAGFNHLDAWGLFATYGYPPDIASAFADRDRREKVKRLLAEASGRGIRVLFGLGLMSWGYDRIIEASPGLQGRSRDGKPLQHVMCGAKEESWTYVEKILDCALSDLDFAGVHIESADLGWCDCPECGGKHGVVGYNARLNIRAADLIRRKWPGKTITSIPINWLGGSGRSHFDGAEEAEIVGLSGHVDAFMDQGWTGTYIAEDRRREFIGKLRCAYGTSGGLWVYPCVRWDRASWFLPHVRRSAAAIRSHFDDGARACMLYQGPMANPGVEVDVAVGGRLLGDPSRPVEEVLAEVVRLHFRPRTPAAEKALVDLFLGAEEAYFGQWDPKEFAARKTPVPGELHLTALFSDVPGPPSYLMEPYLTAEGRRAYKGRLVSLIRDAERLEAEVDDGGRLGRIRRGLAATLQLVDTVRCAKGEPWTS